MSSDLKTVFRDRVVTLAGGQAGLRSSLSAKATEPADAGGEPIVELVASDSTLDRYQERIDPRGWDLKNFEANPVIQNSHQYGDIIHTIGKALITEVRTIAGEARLFQRVLFATAINPIAKIAYEMYRGGFLHAFSVGFIPKEWEDGKRGDDFARKFTAQELLENSTVSIPANPSALALAVKAGAVEKHDLKEAAQLLRCLVKEFSTTDPKPKAAPASPSRAYAPGGPEARKLEELALMAKGLELQLKMR